MDLRIVWTPTKTGSWAMGEGWFAFCKGFWCDPARPMFGVFVGWLYLKNLPGKLFRILFCSYSRSTSSRTSNGSGDSCCGSGSGGCSYIMEL